MDVPSKLSGSPPAIDASEVERRYRLLVDTGVALSGERDASKIARIALDGARHVACARLGIFFFDSEDGTQLYLLSGDDLGGEDGDLQAAGESRFDVIETKAFRSGDIIVHPEFASMRFFAETPFAAEAVRSLMSVPVVSRDGKQLGGILLGHPNIDIFGTREEEFVVTIATQTAAALENASLAHGAERAAAEATRRLRQALDAGDLGTWIWDRESDALDLDERAASLLEAGAPHAALSRSELRKRIVYEQDMGLTAEDIPAALHQGGVYNTEYRIALSDDGIRWVASRGVATFKSDVVGADGTREITGMVGTIQDITVRKTQEASLRQSEKLAATGRLAATIAHEINNPLEAVTNLIYLCKTDPGVPGPIQHLLQTADNELERVSQIAQQTLGFYRDTTRPVDINMSELLTSVANLFSRKMDYKKISCELDVAADLHIFGLQGEIRQVFSNLMVNAIDASSKSLIRIRASRTRQGGKEGVSVLIADHGSGIPQSVRQQLFSPFFTTKQSVGTGLGLWVTRGIVEKQGGTIRFRTSTDVPSGTVFRVFLPAEFLKPENFPSSQTTRIQ